MNVVASIKDEIASVLTYGPATYKALLQSVRFDAAGYSRLESIESELNALVRAGRVVPVSGKFFLVGEPSEEAPVKPKRNRVQYRRKTPACAVTHY